MKMSGSKTNRPCSTSSKTASQSGSHTHVAGGVNNSVADADARKDNNTKKSSVSIVAVVLFMITADER